MSISRAKGLIDRNPTCLILCYLLMISKPDSNFSPLLRNASSGHNSNMREVWEEDLSNSQLVGNKYSLLLYYCNFAIIESKCKQEKLNTNLSRRLTNFIYTGRSPSGHTTFIIANPISATCFGCMKESVCIRCNVHMFFTQAINFIIICMATAV